jgi:hypothetical protein
MIGDARRRLGEFTEGWVKEQIERRRVARQGPCVRITIDCPVANVGLSSPDCPSGAGGRRPNATECRIIDVWRRLKLDSHLFSADRLIQFLKELDRLI